MAKKSAQIGESGECSTSQKTLGGYLSDVRRMKSMTLREVEDATDKEVSNAYLSQIENDKIARPSPHVLHSLADVYSISYENLMERAGYITPAQKTAGGVLRSGKSRHGRAATFANENLTEEEEEKLLEYLAFLRSRRSKGGTT